MIKSTLVLGSSFGGGFLNLSRASPLNFSRNFGLLLSQLSKLCFILSSHLIFFFGDFLDLGGGEVRFGGGKGLVGSLL